MPKKPEKLGPQQILELMRQVSETTSRRGPAGVSAATDRQQDPEMEKLAQAFKSVGLAKPYRALMEAGDTVQDFREATQDRPYGANLPIETRVQLGYELQLHQAAEQLYRQCAAAIRKGKATGIERIRDLVLGSFSRTIGREWLIIAAEYGVVIPIEKDELPKIGQLRQRHGEEFTLGHAVSVLSREIGGRSAVHRSMTDEAFTFFAELLLEVSESRPLVVRGFFQFASVQILTQRGQSKNNDPFPASYQKRSEVTTLKQDRKAYAEAQQLSFFMIAFIEKIKEALIDEDHPCHDLAVRFILTIRQIGQPEQDFLFQLVHMELLADLYFGTGNLTAFLRSLKRVADNQEGGWAQEIYEQGVFYLSQEGHQVQVGFTQEVDRYFVAGDEVDQDDLRRLFAYFLPQLGFISKGGGIAIRSDKLSELDLSYQEIGLLPEDEPEFLLTIEQDNRQGLVECILHLDTGGEQEHHPVRIKFIIDYVSQPINVVLDTIDVESLPQYPNLRNSVLRFVYVLLLGIEKYIEETALEEDQAESVDPSGDQDGDKDGGSLSGDLGFRSSSTNRVKTVVVATSPVSDDRQTQKPKKRKRKSRKRDEGDQPEQESSLRQEVLASRNAPVLILPAGFDWDRKIDPPIQERIRRKIVSYNTALSTHRQITCSGKLFRAELVDPTYGWRIWQITVGEYRVLSRIDPDGDGVAEVFVICNRREVANHVPGYNS